MENIFVARHPIYDRANQLISYELLYRVGEKSKAGFGDRTITSSQIILNSFMDIGFDDLVGSSLAFISITEDFILDESLTPMFENQTVLEIIGDIVPSKEIINGVKRLKDIGYRIALGNFQYSSEFDELLEIADFVKLDVVDLSKESIIRELDNLKKYNIKIVAEKVETPEIYDFCKKLSFDCFQGFHFCKPQIVKHKNIPSNKLVVINLLKELNKEDYDFIEIEKAIAQDATLTFKLLRYVNSAAFTQRKEIDSIKDALVLVGGDTIRKWATLILMMQLAEGKPQALLITALVRARMCELLEGETTGQMFTVGLLSLLDALMDQPMIELLDELTLCSSIKFALLDYEGKNGEILQNVVHYEQGQWKELIAHEVDEKQYFNCYMDAVKWADSTIKSLNN